MLFSEHSKFSAEFLKKLSDLQSDYEKHLKAVEAKPFTHIAKLSDLQALCSKTNTQKISRVFLVGMGGSSLGCKVLTKILPTPEFIFLDNTDPEFLHRELQKIDSNSFFILSSKSGETIEVLSIAKILIKKTNSPKRFIVITDNKTSSLGKLAKEHEISIFGEKTDIPGRFSILSPAGLLPIYYLGGNETFIENIMEGAKSVKYLDAYNFACQQYLHYLEGKNITTMFTYCDGLDVFADWYIQLLSESIGKSKKIGITPTKASGVKDQHSQLQLFLDGPDDKFYVFLKRTNSDFDFEIPGEKHPISSLFNAQYDGVKHVFVERNKPFFELKFDSLNAFTLGELLFFFEVKTAFLGSLFGINFDDQPAVEGCKKNTLKLLI